MSKRGVDASVSRGCKLSVVRMLRVGEVHERLKGQKIVYTQNDVLASSRLRAHPCELNAHFIAVGGDRTGERATGAGGGIERTYLRRIYKRQCCCVPKCPLWLIFWQKNIRSLRPALMM